MSSFLRTHHFEPETEQCEKIGINDYISKPIDLNILQKKLAAFL
jgi:response regulator RpfG family c-di-GMP phosphodiesterase